MIGTWPITQSVLFLPFVGLFWVPTQAIRIYNYNTECGSAIMKIYGDFEYPGIGYPDYYPMLCQNPVALVSLYAAAYTYCHGDEVATGIALLSSYCTNYGFVDLVSASDFAANLTSEAIAALPVYSMDDLVEKSNITSPFLPDKAWYALEYKTSYDYSYEENHHAYYTFTLYGFWGSVLIFGMTQNAMRRLEERQRGYVYVDAEGSGCQSTAPGRPGVLSRINAWSNKDLVTPSLILPYRQKRLLGCTIPTRAVTLVIAAYWILNLVLSCVTYRAFTGNLYWSSKSTQLWRYIADRTGFMAYGNLPLLWMFAGRNNVFIWLTGWSFGTFNIFHRHIARIATLQGIVHSISYTVLYMTFYTFATYKEELAELWLALGIAATVVMSFIVLFSFSIFRQNLYEFFLLAHIILSALLLVFLWHHTAIFTLGNFNHPLLLPPIVIWGFDRFIRLVRQAYCNIYVRRNHGKGGQLMHTRATVSYDEAANMITIDVVPANANIFAGPGQHYYIYQPLRFFGWENHPFTLSQWVEPKALGNESHLVFRVRPYDGWTKHLQRLCQASPGFPISPAMFIEGPYGIAEPLHTFEDILLVAGGSGIACVLPYLQDHVRRVRDKTDQGSSSSSDGRRIPTRTRHITLIWADRREAFIRAIAEGPLASISDREDVTVIAYNTSAGSSSEAVLVDAPIVESADADAEKVESGVLSGQSTVLPSARAAVQIHAGRPDVSAYVHSMATAVQKTTDARLAVMVCGPGELSDQVRHEVAHCMTRGRDAVEYFEESFGW